MLKYHTDGSLKRIQNIVDDFVGEKGTGITKDLDEKSLVLIGSEMKVINGKSQFSFVTLNVQTLTLDKEITNSKNWITDKHPFHSVDDLEKYLKKTTYEELIWFDPLK